jgi:hypothetical protein
MSRDELIARLDGRGYRYVENEVGISEGQLSRWALASNPATVPDHWAPILRARFPLPTEDRFEEGRVAGYKQAISDVHMAVGDLRP